MLPLKEFANFVTLHTADLAQTYVRLLKETGNGYENFSPDSCLVSARKLIKAVVEAFESHTYDPLAKLFDINSGAGLRWPGVNFPFQPLTEIECLGQTLIPVVTSLDAGKFLWQMLSQVRGTLLQAAPIAFTQAYHSEMDEALQASEEKYRSLFEESRDAIFVMTPEGDFIECNPAMLSLFQYTEAEIKQVKAPGIYADPNDGLEFRRALEQKGSVRDFELKMRKKDGTEIDCLLTATPRRSHDRQAIAFQGIIRDVTEQKRNEAILAERAGELQAVQQSQNLLRSIIDATPDWIFIKDQEYRYRLVNQGYANALHLSPEDFTGKNDLELGFPEELVKGNPEKGIRGFWTDDRQVMDSGEPLVNPYDPATIDGKVHIFHTIKAPVRDTAGNITGVLAFARDTTEREQILAEMERRARRERTIRQITDKMRAATSLEELVKTAAQELGERLSAGHAVVELGIDLESNSETGSNGR